MNDKAVAKTDHIAEIKKTIFSILESAFQSTDVTATQQMGVNMTNAVKRDGVVIIQNQNVEIYKAIMPAMVKILKLCDAIMPEPVVIDLTGKTEILDDDPIEACCAWLYENKINWENMQDILKAKYMEYVIKQLGTKKEAAKFFGIQPTYLCKVSRKLNS